MTYTMDELMIELRFRESNDATALLRKMTRHAALEAQQRRSEGAADARTQ